MIKVINKANGRELGFRSAEKAQDYIDRMGRSYAKAGGYQQAVAEEWAPSCSLLGE